MKKSLLCALIVSGTILSCAIANAESNTAPVPAPAAAPTTATSKVQSPVPAPGTYVTSTVPPQNTPNVVYVYTTQPPPNAVTTQPIVQATPTEKDYSFGDNPLFCFGRGLTNIATCWLEIPRCIVYDNEVIPVVGTILGIPEGAGFTLVRALVGVGDILSFGLDGGALYGKYMPSFVWQANWTPPKK